MNEAVAEADRAIAAWGESGQRQPSDAYGLSRRESEVLRLVAEGQSNREIAEALSISVPTVKVQMRAILGKLGLESRTAAAAFAIHNQLI